jgi:hypothetical protein
MNLSDLKVNYPLPFTLLPTQEEDIEALLELDKALADLPVGYGKTCIATYTALGHESDRILVVVPPILITQWVKWLKGIPNVGGVIGYKGNPKERALIDLYEARWVIVSYAILRLDYKPLSAWVLGGSKPEVIVDECQNLKNSGSKLFGNIFMLSGRASTLLMTGTPLSSPMDAYAYCKIKSPGVYRNLSQFERVHVGAKDFFDKPTKWDNLPLLEQNLRLNGVYRDKLSVHAHLRTRTFPIYYDLEPDQMKLYVKLMEEQLLLLDDGSKIDATTSQRLYNAAQQIIVNFGKFAGDDTLRAKAFDLIDQVCDEIAVHRQSSSKLIIWTWFKSTTELVLHYLSGYNAVAAYSGADSVKSVERFMEDPTCRILVAQPGSAGAGLNPQYVCWESLFLESPTRTIPFRQAAGRIDRQGQKYVSNNRVAVARGTIQEELFSNLLHNDDLVNLASGSISSIRGALFGNKSG